MNNINTESLKLLKVLIKSKEKPTPIVYPDYALNYLNRITIMQETMLGIIEHTENLESKISQLENKYKMDVSKLEDKLFQANRKLEDWKLWLLATLV